MLVVLAVGDRNMINVYYDDDQGIYRIMDGGRKGERGHTFYGHNKWICFQAVKPEIKKKTEKNATFRNVASFLFLLLEYLLP